MRCSAAFSGLIISVIIFAILFSPVAISFADESGNAGTDPQLKTIAGAVQTLDKRLAHVEVLIQSLVHPTWEYKVMVPNIINTSEKGRQSIDGIDFGQLGKQGWELVNYTNQYGFIFKRRRIEK